MESYQLLSMTTELGAGIVALTGGGTVKLLSMPTCHIGVVGSNPGCSTLPSSLLMNLGNSRSSPKYLGCCHPHGKPDEVPGSWLWPGSTLVIEAICKANQEMEEHSFFCSLNLSDKCICLKMSTLI